MTPTNEDLLALADRLDEWREHCGYCGRYAVERNSRGQCICAACLAENNPGHWGAVHCDTSAALRAIVAERQAMHLETCPSCSGSGMALDDGGDPGLCHECKGDGLDVRETPVCERQQDLVTADDPRIADYERAYQYALHLADTLRERHYPANTCWRPIGDLPGLLTQIDNMIAGFGPAQVIRDQALDDAARAVSNRAAYWWDASTAADDTGRKKLSLIFESKALACTENAAAIRAMKGKPE